MIFCQYSTIFIQFYILQRIRNECTTADKRKNTRRETTKSNSNLLDIIYSPVEARIRKSRLSELETSLEIMKSKFEREDNNKKEIEKEFMKQEEYSRNTLNRNINNEISEKNVYGGNLLNCSYNTSMSNSNEKYILNGQYVNIKLENSFALTESLSGVQTPIITHSDSDKVINEIHVLSSSNYIVTNFNYEKSDDDDEHDTNRFSHSNSNNKNSSTLYSKFDRSSRNDDVRNKETLNSNNNSRKFHCGLDTTHHSAKGSESNDQFRNQMYAKKNFCSTSDNDTILKDYNYYDDDDDFIAKMAKRNQLDTTNNNEFWQIPFIKIRNSYVLQRAIEYNKNNSTRTCDEKVDGMQTKLISKSNIRVLNSPHQKSQQQLLLKLNSNGHIVDTANCTRFQSSFCTIS